jgi:cbb3-type cytochrome oxidase subunit 3
MKQEILAQSPMLALPLFALFLFLVVFALWIVRTYARRAEAYAEVESLPLADDTGARAAHPAIAMRSPEDDHVQ